MIFLKTESIVPEAKQLISQGLTYLRVTVAGNMGKWGETNDKDRAGSGWGSISCSTEPRIWTRFPQDHRNRQVYPSHCEEYC